MLRLSTTRTSLGLYGALLVLPTLVIGWLYWHQLEQDYRAQLATVPEDAQDAARRIVAAMRERLEKLLADESARSYIQYASMYSPEDAIGDDIAPAKSPLVSTYRPEGVMTWFSFDLVEDPKSVVEVYVGKSHGGVDRADAESRLEPVVESFRNRFLDETPMQRLSSLGVPLPSVLPLTSVAFHRGYRTAYDCLLAHSALMRDWTLPVSVSRFHLEFYRENHVPRAVASRRITLPSLGETDLPERADCLGPLLHEGFSTIQGFFLDVDWLFGDLPFSIASRILKDPEELLYPDERFEPCATCAVVQPVREMGFNTTDPDDLRFGQFEVAIDTERLQQRFESQSRRFLSVGLMLILTLATGMLLLYRSVRSELDQARRMQDFVAAVTHELRTPLSTIRLHGEMLLDGWAREPEKQTEYYRRIVRETNRLSTLVERVLQKSRLKEGSAQSEPLPGNLSEMVESLRDHLGAPDGGSDDLTFDLAPDLPDVWIVPEAIEGILTNLVENARKYAPVPAAGEPIRVSTRGNADQVFLEVSDRGPGVPPEERERIFEAFYRVGSEETRTATGTGLGLHLVHLFAESTRARVSHRARPGGGSIFQVAFERSE